MRRGLRGAAAALLVGACAAWAQPRMAHDDAGTTVVLPAPARRIVTLAPNTTEIVYAAGAGAALVGVVSGSDYPAAARALPRVGSAHSLDLERILALAPDLVITWPYTVPAQLARLSARGIPVYTVDPRSADEIARDIERVGVLAATESMAVPAAQRIRRHYRALTQRFRQGAPIRVFYEVWGTPLVTLGGAHLVSHAIELCGGTNVFAAFPAPAPTVSVEAVLAADPEAIVIGVDGGGASPWAAPWRRWPALSAVRYDNVFTIDGDLLHRPGPRFVEGIDALCTTLERARQNRAAATHAALR